MFFHFWAAHPFVGHWEYYNFLFKLRSMCRKQKAEIVLSVVIQYTMGILWQVFLLDECQIEGQCNFVSDAVMIKTDLICCKLIIIWEILLIVLESAKWLNIQITFMIRIFKVNIYVIDRIMHALKIYKEMDVTNIHRKATP